MSIRILRRAGIAALAAVVASCGPPPPPPPAPPPPPPAPEPFAARPMAPGYAQDGLPVPPLDALGVRQTVNTSLTPAQTTWNLRSAYNVAALNCISPRHSQIADRYGAFLKTHASELAATNRNLKTEFRKAHGPAFEDVRDRYMTQVYNYFSLPPALPGFCDAALSVSEQLATVPAGGLDVAAPSALAQLELVFLNFFNDYESYLQRASAWHIEYEATYGQPYPYAANPRPPAAPVMPAPTYAGDPSKSQPLVSLPSTAMPTPAQGEPVTP